jgi:hypothetical protein
MDLQALRAAIEPLSKFGADELTFEIEGTKVTLRPLLPDEDIAVQQYAAAVLAQTQEEEGLGDDDPLTRAAALKYMDRFKAEAVAYALVQVGPTNLRGLTHIETGELTESGAPIRIPKHVALRQIILDSWSRGMITVAFARYGDLVMRIAEKADEVARENLADLDAEIERLEKRLKDARDERERRAKGDPSVTMQQIRALVDAGEALEREVDDTIEEARESRRVADNIRESSRRWEAEATREESDLNEGSYDDYPIEGADEEDEEDPKPPAPRHPVIPAAAPPPSPRMKPPQAPDDFVSSFADPDEDPRAIEIENARIAMAAAAARRANEEALGNPALDEAKQVGTARATNGKEVPVFKLPAADHALGGDPSKRPTETISGRGRGQQGKGPKKEKDPNMDPDPRKGTLNPNFKPPGRG